MKVLKELPRETLDLVPASVMNRKAPRADKVEPLIAQIKGLFDSGPDKVFLIDCESGAGNHPVSCYMHQTLSSLNAVRAFPGRVRGYHTRAGTMILWIEPKGGIE